MGKDDIQLNQERERELFSDFISYQSQMDIVIQGNWLMPVLRGYPLSKTYLINIHVFYTLGSGYIGIRYIVFSSITSIFASYFWSQKEVYIIDYFGNIVISDLSSIFAWSQRGRYNRNSVYVEFPMQVAVAEVVTYFLIGSLGDLMKQTMRIMCIGMGSTKQINYAPTSLAAASRPQATGHPIDRRPDSLPNSRLPSARRIPIKQENSKRQSGRECIDEESQRSELVRKK